MKAILIFFFIPLQVLLLTTTLSSGEKGSIFKNSDGEGYLQVLSKEKDSCNVTLGFAGFIPSPWYEALTKYYHGELRVKIPETYKIELSITKLIGEIGYNNGKDKVQKILYLFERGGAIYPSILPKDINGAVYASMIDSGGGHEQYQQYKSFDNIPSAILKPDESEGLTIYIVYYDFPQDVSEITYHLILELRKGGKIVKVDSTYNLQKATFKPQMHLD